MKTQPAAVKHCTVCRKPVDLWPMAHRGDAQCSQKCARAAS